MKAERIDRAVGPPRQVTEDVVGRRAAAATLRREELDDRDTGRRYAGWLVGSRLGYGCRRGAASE